jgi:tetratricopeptide (TPR) repeat protein
MSGERDLSPHIRLGLQCRDLRRYADAERHFKEELGADPLNDVALNLLATVIHAQSGRGREALDVIDRAIAIDPNDSQHHAARAFILNGLDRPRDALSAARTARELDPCCDVGITAEAQSHLLLKDWPAAERAAREAMAIDPEASIAANLLAQALRMQNKQGENEAQIAALLHRDPEDEVTHYNAGWAALQRGDHRTAETHFREALRLDPEFDAAREGLLTSFRARSRFYRAYLGYCMRMARLRESAQWAVVIGIYLGYRLIRYLAEAVSPALAVAAGAIYFLLVLWVFVANAFGNFILLFDRFARHALRRDESYEAVAVGGGVATGLALLFLGFVSGWSWAFILGGALAVSAIPLSMVFTNKSRLGAAIFSGIALFMYGGALLAIFALASDQRALFSMGLTILLWSGLAALLSTWFSGVKALRR